MRLTHRNGRSSSSVSEKKTLGPSGSRTVTTSPSSSSSSCPSLGRVIKEVILALGFVALLRLVVYLRPAKDWIGSHLRKSARNVVDETPPAKPAAAPKEEKFCGSCQYRGENWSCNTKMGWSMDKDYMSAEAWKKQNLKYCINTSGCDEQASGFVTCPGSVTS